jgi:hypothetical protein
MNTPAKEIEPLFAEGEVARELSKQLARFMSKARVVALKLGSGFSPLTIGWRLQELLSADHAIAITWSGDRVALERLLGKGPVILSVPAGSPSLEGPLTELSQQPIGPLRLVLIVDPDAECFGASQWFVRSWAIEFPSWHDLFPDVGARANELLRLLALRDGAKGSLSPEALETVRSLRWPGGEPELLARLEHGLAFARSGNITTDALDLAPAHGEALQMPSLQEALEAMQLLYVAAVIVRCGGNRSQAARALSCDVRSVFRYVEKLQREDTTALRATWSVIRGLIGDIGPGPLV